MKRQVKSEYLFMFKFYSEKNVLKMKLFYYYVFFWNIAVHFRYGKSVLFL